VKYLTALLDATHKKSEFFCGKTILDNYLHIQASQDQKKKAALCFVLTDTEQVVIGYYTLSGGSIPRSQIPEDVIKKLKLPRYRDMPVTLLGRLAVDSHFSGQGWGANLLIDALKRSYEVAASAVASFAVVVDPIDEEAESFYAKFGFIYLTDSKRMFFPLKSIASLF
jgi:predicted GNAT family N-acyltransferase